MGRLIKGPFGTNLGKMGGYTSYLLNGEIVTRQIGIPSYFSGAQYDNQGRTAIVTTFLSPLLDVVNLGFKTATKEKAKWSAYNQATSLIKRFAVTGEGESIAIDYPKVQLAMGVIPVPLNPQVKLEKNELVFNWEPDLDAPAADEDDQVVCVAYFPDYLQAFTILSGAKRPVGEQRMIFPSWTETLVVETYFYYVSSDRNRMSNSLYTGQLIWDH